MSTPSAVFSVVAERQDEEDDPDARTSPNRAAVSRKFIGGCPCRGRRVRGVPRRLVLGRLTHGSCREMAAEVRGRSLL